MVGDDVILHGDWNLDEDVVFGFGFDVEGELLDAEIDAAGDLVEPGEFEIDAGAGYAQEFSHALDYDGLGGVDLEESAEGGADYKDGDIAATANEKGSIRFLLRLEFLGGAVALGYLRARIARNA